MSDRVVIVASFATAAEAEMACRALEAEEIPSRIEGEATGTQLAGYLGPVAAGIRVVVRPADAERAEAVLAARVRDDRVAVFGGTWTCEACGAEVDDAFEACWSCGGSTEGEADPDFERVVEAGPAGEDAEALDEGEDAGTGAPPPPDEIAHRALRAALLGSVLFPPILHLVSLVYLADLLGQRDALTPKGRRHLILALVIDAVFLVGAVVVITQLLR